MGIPLSLIRLTAAITIAIAVPTAAEAANSNGKAPAELTDSNKKICRTLAATGSHMRKRICHTQAEWAEFDKTVGDRAEQTLDRRRANTAGGTNDFN